MKIFLNVNNNISIKNEIVSTSHETTQDFNSCDVAFIEWQGKTTFNFIKNNLSKKKKLIVFDRNLSMDINDANWLSKQNVILTEPALNFRRKHFFYLPFWIKYKSYDEISMNEKVREYDLVFKDDIHSKMTSFNKYYLEYAKLYSNTVYVDSKSNIPQDVMTRLNNSGVVSKDVISFEDSKFTIIIGSPLDYDIGYLNDSFVTSLSMNCIPIVPTEHKYYSLLTSSTFYKIESIFDINYYISTYDSTHFAYIHSIYENIKKYYPEMLVESTLEQIIEFVKGG